MKDDVMPFYLRNDVSAEEKAEYYRLAKEEWEARRKKASLICVILLGVCFIYLAVMSLLRTQTSFTVPITFGEGATVIVCFIGIYIAGKYLLFGRYQRPVELEFYEKWLEEESEGEESEEESVVENEISEPGQSRSQDQV
jgi:hypothetical protein